MPSEETSVVSTESIDSLLATTLKNYEAEHLRSYDSQIPLEQDFFGRVKNIVEGVFEASEGAGQLFQGDVWHESYACECRRSFRKWQRVGVHRRCKWGVNGLCSPNAESELGHENRGRMEERCSSAG